MNEFWQQHPALLYSLAFLLGCFIALNFSWLLLFPILLLFYSRVPFSSSIWSRFLLAAAMLCAGCLYVKAHYSLPKLPPQGIYGTAHLEVDSLSVSTTHFGKFWVYKGSIRTFMPKHADSAISKGYNIPYRLAVPTVSDVEHPPADKEYRLQGILKEHQGTYSFSVKKNESWTPVPKTNSFAETRFHAKQAVSKYIHQHVKDPLAATFLSGIAIGEFDDRRMSYEFGRFGLLHILAISGFHFSIITFILSLPLGLMLSRKKMAASLIFILTTYFVFLGNSPSIARAWIAIMITLAGYLLEKKGNGLNSLGIAMLAILIYNPLLCRNIGFQFSFLATAAILMLFPGIDRWIQKIFPKRQLSQMVTMNKLEQHGYFLLSCCRQALALTCAVNIATLPLVLYYFQKFSLMSFLYNLFVPLMVSFSMLFLIVGSIASLVCAPAGQLIHDLNSLYTRFVLNSMYNMPATVDWMVRMQEFPLIVLVLHLCGVFYLGVWMLKQSEKLQDEKQDFAFL
jgi:competence protein ComEC